MDSAERLAEAMGWEIGAIKHSDQSVVLVSSEGFLNYYTHAEVATLLSLHDRAQAADDLAEALKGCNGALIGASEALLARGYVATADTLKKYIGAGEEAVAHWNALKGAGDG